MENEVEAKAAEAPPLIMEINDEDDMESLKKMSHECLVIVDFFATWCGPCKSVKVAYEKLAEQETSVKFAKLDIDIYEDAPSDYSIVAMPTFMAFKNGEMVDSVIGPHIEQVKQMVARLK
ncbi:Thioredoxin H-type 2 [Taenia crassiceps]|uniref:Thioredoxin H-type 2 n=1 Tax=Taenia crassiceps TaxID=6207 RepID=A0ABR4Q9M2_9CEST